MSSNNSTIVDSRCHNLTNTKFKTALIVDATTRVLQVIVFALTIILILMFLRKKAINNPAKRFGLSFIFTFSLASVNRVVIELYPASSLPSWFCAVTMTVYCLGSTVILYVVALSIALLLQVSTPIFPERYRHKLTPKIPFIEVALHLMIVIISGLINGLQLIDPKQKLNFCRKCVTLFYYGAIALSFSAIALFVTILTLMLVYCRFRGAVVLTKKTRQVMLKVFLLFLAIDAAFIGDLTLSFIKEFTFQMSIVLSIFTTMNLVFVPILIVLVYSPNTRYRTMCCCPLASRETMPLLLQQSHRAHTNPDSEWDHDNDPSYTPSYHPAEMSDCKSDTV